MPRWHLPPALIAGILVVPAIGASWVLTPVARAQLITTTTTITLPITTTTEATTTTSTTAAPTTTTTTTETTTTTTTSTTTTTTTAPSPPPPGTLSISAPSSTELSTGTPTNAGTLSAHLGAVVVQDTRGGVNATWTATVTATDFTTGDASAIETIPRAAVSYWSGPPTDAAGVGVYMPGQADEAHARTLDVPRTAFSMGSGVGDNAVTWNPTILVTIPSSAVIGTYSGTITHSAA